MEQTDNHDILLGIMVNQCVAIPKARTIPIIIINTNKYNVRVRQPLLAGKLHDVECDQTEYRSTMDQKGSKLGFNLYLLS